MALKANVLEPKSETFAQFWDRRGDIFFAPRLDTLSLMRLSEAATALHVAVLRQTSRHWFIAVEVTQLLRMSAAMQARSLCTNNSDSSTPVAQVHLPHKNLLSGLPQHLVDRASECTELTWDFSPLAQFQATCSHSSVLTGDPWEHVVLKFILDASLLDRSLMVVRRALQHVQVLKILRMPSLALLRKVIQDAESWSEEPMAFPVLRQLAGLRQLRVLALESARPHPDSIMVLSTAAFASLTNDVLPLLPLEELSISTVVVEPSHDARASQHLGMDLGPFLKLKRLKRLKLAVVRSCGESQPRMARGPLVLDLRETCQLEHLDLSFLADPGDSPGGVTVPDDTPASLTLRTVTLRNIGNSPSELRPQLGRYLSACPQLRHVLLSGLQLQVDFLEQVVRSLTTDEALPKDRSPQWSLDWIQHLSQFSAPGNRSCDAQLLDKAAAAFARHGGQVHAREGVPAPPDLRMTSESAASMEQQPTAGLSTFGEGMDWFLGGVPPAALSVHQQATINSRYSC